VHSECICVCLDCIEHTEFTCVQLDSFVPTEWIVCSLSF